MSDSESNSGDISRDPFEPWNEIRKAVSEIALVRNAGQSAGNAVKAIELNAALSSAVDLIKSSSSASRSQQQKSEVIRAFEHSEKSLHLEKRIKTLEQEVSTLAELVSLLAEKIYTPNP